jgi:hypothetical protein
MRSLEIHNNDKQKKHNDAADKHKKRAIVMNLIAITLMGLFGLALMAGALWCQAQYRKFDIDPS